MKTIGLAAVAVAVTMAAPAAALTASGGSVSFTGPTDFNTSLGLLSKFNPQAGVLNAVTFTYAYGFDSQITVSASSDSTGSVSTQSGLGFDSSDAAIRSILNTTVNRTSTQVGASSLDPAAFNLNGSRSVYTLSPGTSATYASAASASRTTTVTDAGVLSAFSASNSSTVFDIFGRTLTGLLLSSTGGNASATQQTRGTASFGISYDYTAPAAAVPEPATWAMFIAGFGLVGGALRRRSRAALPAA